MMQNTIAMRRNKKIALIAHDNKKEELFEWAKGNCKLLAEHSLFATGATGQLLKSRLGLNLTQLQSGALGGDQQIGSRISEGQIDFVVFFSDPLEPQPHDADIKALLRIAVVWNIPVACNRASADFIISSPLMSTVYERKVPDYSKYRALPAARAVEGDELASLGDLPATRWPREWGPKPLPDGVSSWAHFTWRAGTGSARNPKIYSFMAAVWKQICTSLE
jgi:methylglyoxal synthase